MNFRSILSGSVLLLALSASAQAGDRSASGNSLEILPGISVPLPKGWFGRHNAPAAQPDVRMAQAADPRVNALEEQVRQLNGTIEELNFQLLQMQEQLRKMQEDNEFRFQELEGGKRSDPGNKPRSAAPSQKKSETEQPAAAPAETAPATTAATGTSSQTDAAAPARGSADQASKSFGTITFDQNGNVTGGSIGDQATISGGSPVGEAAAPDQQNTTVAALPATDDPEELYRNSYQFILSGDYGTAEAGFRDHIARFPEDAKSPDAHFWLGELLLGQKKYRDAAEVFLAANKDYPKSKKAPEMLFKLGVSLLGLNQRDVACATFSEVGKRYPEVSGALKERVKQEQSLAAC